MDKQQLLQNSKKLEKICWIYFLIVKSDIIYIWKSEDVIKRLSNHPHSFERYYYLPFEKELLDEAENYYIMKYNPILNNRINKLQWYLSRKELKDKYWLWKIFLKKYNKKINIIKFKKESYYNEDDILSIKIN